MRTRRGLCYPRVVEDKNMRVVKRRRDFAAEQVSYRKRSRNSSDIAGKRDLFDSLPDDLVISILCKLSSSATCPSDFANVLLTAGEYEATLGLLPSVTQDIAKYKIVHQPIIYVLDTPGVLVPSISDIETGLKLALAEKNK
ncbi:uncharacterized protein LOC115952500 isoform X2 [Quercus lobata]|uniref:uncharacterized protein LOC115952500 isoform X2 n=1 Tax=Quercus lobata TaxID=97700 RepID=UPI001244D73D|nr:uncharacterized protein LOC115952500 isoform X2 [Quercus lobata]